MLTTQQVQVRRTADKAGTHVPAFVGNRNQIKRNSEGGAVWL